MKNYTIYEVSSGRILRTGRSATLPDVPEGCEMLDVTTSDPEFKTVVNKQVVDVPPQKTLQDMENEARRIRFKLLLESDYTQLSDSPRDKQAWAEYRQALRDVPQQTGFPANIEWPTKPE